MRKITVAGLRGRINVVGHRAKQVAVAVAERLDVVPEEAVHGHAPGRAAGHAAWLERKENRVESDVVRRWRTLRSWPVTGSRIAVVLHLAEGDEFGQFADELAAIPVSFDLFVTNSGTSAVRVDTAALPFLKAKFIVSAKNQGKSLLPLISLVNADFLEPYELVLKLTSKANRAALIGSEDTVKHILAAFANDPLLGSVSAPGTVVDEADGEEVWGENREVVAALLQRIELGLDSRRLRFASDSAYWIRGFVLQGLRALQLSEWDFEDEFGQRDGTTAHALVRAIGLLTHESGYEIREVVDLPQLAVAEREAWDRYAEGRVASPRARLVAFYSADSYLRPEGEEFADSSHASWVDIAAARALYRGQHQPALPAELGFYDLRAPAVFPEQYRLATQAGIEGFLFEYFWADGEKHRNDALKTRLDAGGAEPFCLLWNNEHLVPTGAPDELRGQIAESSAVDFIEEVLPYLRNPHYLRVAGKPLLAIGRLDRIENMPEVIGHWRKRAEEEGLEGLLIVALDEGFRSEAALRQLLANGPDAVMSLPPRKSFLGSSESGLVDFYGPFHGTIRRYDLLADSVGRSLYGDHDFRNYPAVPVTFDDTVSRGPFAELMIGANPFTFRRWLDSAVSSVAVRDREDRIVFIQSWNAWHTGAVLEPSRRFGHSYLLAVRDVMYR